MYGFSELGRSNFYCRASKCLLQWVLINVIIEVDALEIPIMDGSASPSFIFCSPPGLKRKTRPETLSKMKKAVRVEDGDKWAELLPYQGFKLSFAIDFDHPAIESEQQTYVLDFSSQAFIKEISRARTFGLCVISSTCNQKSLVQWKL